MQTIMQRRSLRGLWVALAAMAALPACDHGSAGPGTPVSLVRQDGSDCTNSDVTDKSPSLVGGTVWVDRKADITNVKVAITAQPRTTYHFYLKCVRQLGDITTDDKGVGTASFTFPSNAVGAVFAFDMYPEGAPAGNKYQSVRVTTR